MAIKDLSAEQLAFEFQSRVIMVTNYPNNKSHYKNLEVVEKELIKRLGGSYEKYKAMF